MDPKGLTFSQEGYPIVCFVRSRDALDDLKAYMSNAVVVSVKVGQYTVGSNNSCWGFVFTHAVLHMLCSFTYVC